MALILVYLSASTASILTLRFGSGKAKYGILVCATELITHGYQLEALAHVAGRIPYEWSLDNPGDKSLAFRCFADG